MEVCNCERSYSNYKIVGPTAKYSTSNCKPNNCVNIVATTIAGFFSVCSYGMKNQFLNKSDKLFISAFIKELIEHYVCNLLRYKRRPGLLHTALKTINQQVKSTQETTFTHFFYVVLFFNDDNYMMLKPWDLQIYHIWKADHDWQKWSYWWM